MINKNWFIDVTTGGNLGYITHSHTHIYIYIYIRMYIIYIYIFIYYI